MGSLSINDIVELRAEVIEKFDEIFRLNIDLFKKMATDEISICTGVAPEGILHNNLQFYTDTYSIYICFGHNNLLTVFKNHVEILASYLEQPNISQ